MAKVPLPCIKTHSYSPPLFGDAEPPIASSRWRISRTVSMNSRSRDPASRIVADFTEPSSQWTGAGVCASFPLRQGRYREMPMPPGVLLALRQIAIPLTEMFLGAGSKRGFRVPGVSRAIRELTHAVFLFVVHTVVHRVAEIGCKALIQLNRLVDSQS